MTWQSSLLFLIAKREIPTLVTLARNDDLCAEGVDSQKKTPDLYGVGCTIGSVVSTTSSTTRRKTTGLSRRIATKQLTDKNKTPL